MRTHFATKLKILRSQISWKLWSNPDYRSKPKLSCGERQSVVEVLKNQNENGQHKSNEIANTFQTFGQFSLYNQFISN